jgi:hypothetical protein
MQPVNEMSSNPPEVAGLLRALAADEAGNGASSAVRRRLLEEVRSLRRNRRRARLKMALAACVLTVATAGQLWYLATADFRGRGSAKSDAVAGLPTRELVTAFFPLRYSSVPMNGGRLLRVQLPREALTAFGIEQNPAGDRSSSQRILADVIVGDDGLARAVRFVRQSTEGVGPKEGFR